MSNTARGLYDSSTATFAIRATFHEARRAFNRGATILVSDRGEVVLVVWPHTTTHTRETTTWPDLVEQVRMWANRHPRQRYYVVEGS